MENALKTQLDNIQTKTGKSLEALYLLIDGSGLARHGEIRAMLKDELGLGHGDANTLAAMYRQRGDPKPQAASLYEGAKAALLPIHEAVMREVSALGPFEVAPKKTYLSLRRKKQFAMVGPATKTQVEIGLNAVDLPPADRLKPQKPGGMCRYKVRLSDPSEVDEELVGWLRRAFETAG